MKNTTFGDFFRYIAYLGFNCRELFAHNEVNIIGSQQSWVLQIDLRPEPPDLQNDLLANQNYLRASSYVYEPSQYSFHVQQAPEVSSWGSWLISTPSFVR